LTIAALLAYRGLRKDTLMNRALVVSGLAAALALATSGCGERGETKILNLEPRAGALQGNQPVRIQGANFRTDIGYTVYFGSKKSKQVTILDEGTLLVASPESQDTGAVDIIVAADDGPAWKIHEAFRYEDMAGSVVEQLGETEGEAKGKLAY
jgi:hypothetical protein